jgi:ATP-dependent helicase/nuclease subunit B
VPSTAEVRSGVRPQLLVEAMIAAGGGFPDVPATTPTEILYWGLKGGGDEPTKVGRPAEGEELRELLGVAREGIGRLLAHFADPESAYIAIPRPEIAPTYSDYDHLARVAEWRDGGEGGA